MSLKAKTVLTICAFFAVPTLVFFAVSRIVASELVAELGKETALILQVNAERCAARASEAARKAFGIYLVVLVGVLSCALAVFWLDRTVLSRLMELIGDITGTGGNPGHPQRVQVLEGRMSLPSCPWKSTACWTGWRSTGEMASPDGRLWHITASPVMDKNGNIVGAVEGALDITERKRYEEQLKYLTCTTS